MTLDVRSPISLKYNDNTVIYRCYATWPENLLFLSGKVIELGKFVIRYTTSPRLQRLMIYGGAVRARYVIWDLECMRVCWLTFTFSATRVSRARASRTAQNFKRMGDEAGNKTDESNPWILIDANSFSNEIINKWTAKV